jgi:leucyl aminopeptidase
MTCPSPADIRFAAQIAPDAASLVIVHDRAAPGGDIAAWSPPIDPRVLDALAERRADEPLDIPLPHGLAATRLLLWPVADLAGLGETGRRRLGGRLAAALRSSAGGPAAVVVDTAAGPDRDRWIAELAYGAALRAYRFGGYRTGPDTKAAFASPLAFRAPDPEACEGLFAPYRARAEGAHLARDLLAEPPNILTPRAFAARAADLTSIGLEVEILDRAALEAIGMNALLAVARGSAEPPFVCVLRWRGRDDETAPLALVGKGVTFDSGGLNIKPAAFMYKLKMDMGGAAAVTATLRSLAVTRAPVNVVGVIGLLENMPDGGAYRAGDVLTTLSGRTVEVIDTDNEGRLLLCDLITYVRQRFKPRALVDIATLTGGARLALGALYTPLFSNDDTLAAALMAAGAAEDELLWRLPTGPQYDFMFTSPIADMSNGRTDPAAHAIMGARFLERFVGDTPWAHIDMGATHTADADQDTVPAGFTGFGAALLDRFARTPIPPPQK